MQSDTLLIILSVMLHFYTYLTYKRIKFVSTHWLTYLHFKGYLCVYTNSIQFFLPEINVFVFVFVNVCNKILRQL